MKPLRHPLRLALAALALLGPIAAAQAQPVRVQVHEPFFEGRFTLKNLKLAGRGPSLELPRGGRVDATVELNQDCRDCGATSNQIIIGLAGEPSAQACVYSGAGRSRGWATARFALDVPPQPGIYEIRARYAQAWDCGQALGWWRTDRPHGPGPEATIGVVVVLGDVAPPPVHRPRRELRELRRAIDDTFATLDDLHRQIAALSARKPNGGRLRTIADLTRRADDATRELRLLQDDLVDLLVPDRRDDERPGRPGRPDDRRPPPIVQPDIVVVTGPPPAPLPLSPAETRELVKRLDDAAFPDAMQNALRDSLNAGAYFTIGSALQVLEQFPHETHKVDVAVMLCPRIVENGALPRIIGAFVFESYRQEVRERTGNRCGWEPQGY